MRLIDTIIIHATATREWVDLTFEQIKNDHIKNRGFNDIGYHFVILLDGTIKTGRPIGLIGSHCKGFNKTSIGISYVGGLDANGKAKDTRTVAQKIAMQNLVTKLRDEYDIKVIAGHRDFSPDLNKNGIIERNEWIKMCPCFQVDEEFKI